MKAKITQYGILTLLCSLGSLQAQIRSDFVLFQEGYDPHIALDSQGNLHATVGTTFDGIYYGLFDSLGNEIRAPRRISARYDALEPRLTIRENNVVVVWWIRTTFGHDFIVGKQLTASGDTVSSDIFFNEGCCDFFSADVAFLNDSTYIVVWSGDDPLTVSPEGIYGQIVTTSQRFVGDNLLLSDHQVIGTDFGRTRVLSHPTKEEFIVVWRDNHSGYYKAYGRLFFSDGTPKDSSFVVSEDPDLTVDRILSAAANPDGFAVVWSGTKESNRQIQWRRFGSDGTPLSASEKVNSSSDVGFIDTPVDITFDSDGSCVISWTEIENGIFKNYAQRYFPDAAPFGNNFRISAGVLNLSQFSPSAILRHGRLYTAWSELEDTTATNFVTKANILEFSDPSLEVENPNEDIPQTFHLFQNYPNPFNPTTTIKFAVSRRSHIQLVIYNVLGEEVITLKNEELLPGIHVVQWNGKNSEGTPVPSGIYFYRLQVGDYAQTKKMVFIQ